MNGGRALIRTLVVCGVDTYFVNPGTPEMQFVAAFDAVPEMRRMLAPTANPAGWPPHDARSLPGGATSQGIPL
jgi:thiamine pyrophosphate-dependent acetolactate synthase large subunit-like protein